MRQFLPLFLLLGLVGCGPKEPTATSEPAKPAPAPVNEAAMRLDGPGGTVSIGDTLDQAKAAFPAPKDAEVFDNAMNFAITGNDGWAWAIAMGTGFEAMLIDGKVAAMILTELDGPKGEDDVAHEIAQSGEPTRMAESENAAMYVWESGENARFYVLYKYDSPLLGVGSFTIIGPKDTMKLLSYHYDEPELFVKLMDSAKKQLDDLPPDMKEKLSN